MGLLGYLAGFTGFRTAMAVMTVGLHVASWPTMAYNPPLALAMISAADACGSMLVAPPGSNPLENAVVAATTTASGPA